MTPAPFKKAAFLSKGHLGFAEKFKLLNFFNLNFFNPTKAIIAALSPHRFCGGNMGKIKLEVNGTKVEKEVSDNTLLSTFLREHLNLTGTHVGCDTSQCGACVVHVNGNSLKSCTTLAADINGSKVTTIEGLASNGKMHPMQDAFKKLHGLQCGFCTPGMVMSAIDLVQKNKKPSDSEIRDWLEGNICRCTGYQNIVAAVKEASTKM